MQNKNKYIIYILLFAIILLTIVLFAYTEDKRIDTKNRQYISNLGFTISKNYTISYIKISESFKEEFSLHNYIYSGNKYYLSNCLGKTLKIYTYSIKSKTITDNKSLFISILLFKDKIIGSAVHTIPITY